MFKIKKETYDKNERTHKKKLDEELQSLQKLSNETKTHPSLTSVPEHGKLFRLGTHKVTGKELNTSLSQISDEIIRSKNLNLAILNHITVLYQAIDALDDAHISGIMAVANATKDVDDKVNVNSGNIEIMTDLLKNNPQYIKLENMVNTLDKKLKTSYCIAGSSIALAIITLLLCVGNII